MSLQNSLIIRDHYSIRPEELDKYPNGLDELIQKVGLSANHSGEDPFQEQFYLRLEKAKDRLWVGLHRGKWKRRDNILSIKYAPGCQSLFLYTQFCRREAVAQRRYRLSEKASLAGANKIQAGSLCYFTPSRGCRGFVEIAPGCPRETARHSGKQCSIGFQPVSFAPSSDAFQVSSVSPNCVPRSGLKPWAESYSPGGKKHPK
jgi:hypothetical protein